MTRRSRSAIAATPTAAPARSRHHGAPADRRRQSPIGEAEQQVHRHGRQQGGGEAQCEIPAECGGSVERSVFDHGGGQRAGAADDGTRRARSAPSGRGGGATPSTNPATAHNTTTAGRTISTGSGSSVAATAAPATANAAATGAASRQYAGRNAGNVGSPVSFAVSAVGCVAVNQDRHDPSSGPDRGVRGQGRCHRPGLRGASPTVGTSTRHHSLRSATVNGRRAARHRGPSERSAAVAIPITTANATPTTGTIGSAITPTSAAMSPPYDRAGDRAQKDAGRHAGHRGQHRLPDQRVGRAPAAETEGASDGDVAPTPAEGREQGVQHACRSEHAQEGGQVPRDVTDLVETVDVGRSERCP